MAGLTRHPLKDFKDLKDFKVLKNLQPIIAVS
jgi:hypothetical protein